MKSLGIIVLCFCLWSCGNTRHIPKFNWEKVIKKEFDISKSAKKVRYIPLEAGPENFSCPVKYFIDAGKFYYVTDEYSILKYTSEGKFVCKIGDWGNVIYNKAYITDPELKRISETLTPDSGVVLLEIKIKNLKFK